MFGDRSPFDDVIRELMAMGVSFEELLEMCDISCERVLEILLEEGHIQVPPFLDKVDDDSTLESYSRSVPYEVE